MIKEFNSLYRKLDDLEGKGLSQLMTLDRRITGGSASKRRSLGSAARR